MQAYFPTTIEGDDAEGYCADVLGAGVLGEGATPVDALRNAAEILQEIIWDAVREETDLPSPGEASAEDLARGRLALAPATLPAIAA